VVTVSAWGGKIGLAGPFAVVDGAGIVFVSVLVGTVGAVSVEAGVVVVVGVARVAVTLVSVPTA
jgi:hypothetical protein